MCCERKNKSAASALTHLPNRDKVDFPKDATGAGICQVKGESERTVVKVLMCLLKQAKEFNVDNKINKVFLFQIIWRDQKI